MFIYVMDTESRNKLIELGYDLLKSNDKVWIFANKHEMEFSSDDIPCVISDTLIF